VGVENKGFLTGLVRAAQVMSIARVHAKAFAIWFSSPDLIVG